MHWLFGCVLQSSGEYSDWFSVPTDRSNFVTGPQNGHKFQIRTNKAFYGEDAIRLTLKGPGESAEEIWFYFGKPHIDAKYCKHFQSYTGNEGFLTKAGIVTFLKTASELKIWFDDDLEVTWVYEDLPDQTCGLRNEVAEIKFEEPSGVDGVSGVYRYAIG